MPAAAGLLPRHSYQWTFVPSGGGGNDPSWQGFTIDYVRAGREPSDSFGPLAIGLASGTVQTAVQTQAVQSASGTVQIGLSHRGGYTGTPTGEPWFPEDPAGALPVGWVFSGVDANVPWVRISAVDGVGGSGTRAVTLQAFDGSLLEYTNTDGGSGGWAPPVGVGRPANDYGTLAQSSDGSHLHLDLRHQRRHLRAVGERPHPVAGQPSPAGPARRRRRALAGAAGELGRAGAPGAASPIRARSTAAGRPPAWRASTTAATANAQPRPPAAWSSPPAECCAPSSTSTAAAPRSTTVRLPPRSATVQLGQVDLPGGATWSFEWQTASYTLTNNTTVTAPQLLSVQTPRGS